MWGVPVRTSGVGVQVRTGDVGCAGEDWWCGVCW